MRPAKPAALLSLIVATLCLCCCPALAYAATLAVCNDPLSARPGLVSHSMYGAGGELLTLAVSESAFEQAGCVTQNFPVAASAIHWFSLSGIPSLDAAPTVLNLQGHFPEGGVQVSEVIWKEESPGTSYLPFNTNMLPALQRRAFGVEERVVLTSDNSFQCAAGTAAAGVYFQSEALWKGTASMELEIVASGSGRFQFAIADAERAAREAPLVLGALPASDIQKDNQKDEQMFRLRFVLPENKAPWQSLSIVCPADSAALTLQEISLHPRVATTVTARSAWLWSPRLWLDSPQAIWRLATTENLGKVFITIPLTTSGSVEHADLLSAFIAQSKARNLDIWAVIGDPHDVLPENLAALQNRVAAYQAYNAQHPATERIAGLQLDIEPYLLPGYRLAPELWRERYVQTVKQVHDKLAGSMPLNLVMPVWWGTHPQLGDLLLSQLQWPALGLTVMNYRTNSDDLRAGALPFLIWGQDHKVDISMALELGSIGEEETRLTFVSGKAAGELWLLALGDYRLLVLLAESHTGLPGLGYSQEAERIISNANVSFGGALDHLHAIADAMAREWSAWPSFSGIAIHGLEEFQMQQSE